MATKLSNEVVRESSTKVNDREIIVSLNEDQTISMKLKGMKSGTVSIGIKELWNTLNDTKPEESKKRLPIKKDGKEPMIPLYRLRTLNATTPGKIETIARVDELIVDLIEETKTE